MIDYWDERFIGLAHFFAERWSKDPSTRCGAVIVRPDRTIASMGYNGFPRCVRDTPSRLADRPTKYAFTVHAELNAIINARQPLQGCNLYVIPFSPCSACAAAIINAGIARVVYQGAVPERWTSSVSGAMQMFKEASVIVEEIR